MKFDRASILGSGGYGVVFRGEWNNKRVAVKRIEKTNCENNKGEDALQKLHHPNVVKLYHVDSDRFQVNKILNRHKKKRCSYIFVLSNQILCAGTVPGIAGSQILG